MFTPFIVLSFAAAAIAGPLKRFDGLTVSVTGPGAEIGSVDDLKFTASVTNSGTEDVKILKYATILDDGLPTRSFTVTKDGKPVSFTGVKLSVSLEDDDDSAYTFIAAGETVTVSHDVSTLFDFESAGEGTYNFEPITNFHIAPTLARITGAAVLDGVSASANSVEVTISGDLARRELYQRNKRAVNICEDEDRKTFIDDSYTEAKVLAAGAYDYMKSHLNNSDPDPLVKAYYGTTNNRTLVASVFTDVLTENSSTRTLSCVDSYGVCVGTIIAYTRLATTDIYYCDRFFTEVATTDLCTGNTTVAARNVHGGTTLHELTHALSGTSDVNYGCVADQALKDSLKLENADNYNCFSTEVYVNTQC